MVEMATIRNRGEYQWEAQIRRKGYPAQRKTFETKSDAQAWARMIESEIDRGIFVSRVEAERTAFHELIDRYISEVAPKHKGAYSEIKRLEALKRHPLATRIVATLTSSDFARYRDERLKIRKGNTVNRHSKWLVEPLTTASGCSLLVTSSAYIGQGRCMRWSVRMQLTGWRECNLAAKHDEIMQQGFATSDATNLPHSTR
jgi:hypothetical protein